MSASSCQPGDDGQLLSTRLRDIADIDLFARLERGCAVYPLLLIILAVATPYRSEHPRVFWGAAFAISLGIILRIALAETVKRRSMMGGRNLLMSLLGFSVVLTSAATGGLYFSTLCYYGLTNWTFTIVMLGIVGMASGSTISFTPDFRLLLLHICLLFGPAMAWGVSALTKEGGTFAFATLVLIAFLLLQGHRLHGMYWNLLRDQDLAKKRTRELQAAKAAAEAAREVMEFQATHDALTGIPNRREVLAYLQREQIRAERNSGPIGVLMMDLDHFKNVNDSYGHLVGDEVLKQCADRLRQGVRVYDAVGRYGGEEFIVLLPGCGEDQIKERAEDLRSIIADVPFDVSAGKLRITVSIGASVIGAGMSLAEREILKVADEALYEAKRAGRNRVVIAPPTRALVRAESQGSESLCKPREL